jgi:uncharacterized protein YbaA (DUF1428 family)
MNKILLFLTLTWLVGIVVVVAADKPKDSRCYEMRVYYAAPGKLDELHARFRDHTCKLFEKHGIENLGYWVPLDNPDNKLIYILAYPSREARDKSWKEFMADPDWQAASKASEVNGKLVTKADSRFMTATDYSPEIKASRAGEPRAFELRTYTSAPGKLDALDARFRDHTVKLFGKHGMENIGYWHLMADQKGADEILIYLLAHKSKEAADASFKAFRDDPSWVAARKASEENAGGSLTAEKGVWTDKGVDSVFMKPTDYSQMK